MVRRRRVIPCRSGKEGRVMLRFWKGSVHLFAGVVILVAAAAGLLRRADGALPGTAADAETVATIRGRGLGQACAAVADDKCSGNRPEGTTCLGTGGGQNGPCTTRSQPPNPD